VTLSGVAAPATAPSTAMLRRSSGRPLSSVSTATDATWSLSAFVDLAGVAGVAGIAAAAATAGAEAAGAAGAGTAGASWVGGGATTRGATVGCLVCVDTDGAGDDGAQEPSGSAAK
jgi:hypothetical protein